MDIKLNNKESRLLMEVGKVKEFYPGLSEDKESILLRRLARLDSIKWCPYPEEFYFITSLGKSLLGRKK